MASSQYTVTLTNTGSTQYVVGPGEYEQLTDLGLIASLIGVSVPLDQVVITTVTPATPFIGLVWFNPNIP